MCDDVAKTDVAKTATAWWIERIKKRGITLYPERVIKDKSNLIVVDVSLQEVLSRFEEALYIEIRNNLEKYPYLYLGCSYYPDKLLSELAKKAQLPLNYFPLEADMEINGTSIRVSYGSFDWYELRSSA